MIDDPQERAEERFDNALGGVNSAVGNDKSNSVEEENDEEDTQPQE
jgi:hypothetical protein